MTSINRLIQVATVFVLLSALGTANAVSITMSPSDVTLTPGDIVEINIIGDFSDDPTVGGGFDILYNPEQIAVLDVAQEDDMGNCFVGDCDFTMLGGIDNVNGVVSSVTFGAFAGLGGSDFLIATVTVQYLGGDMAQLVMRDTADQPGPFFSAITFLQQFVEYSGITIAPVPDSDADGIPDSMDNCVTIPNGPDDINSAGPSQNDADNDGFGNRCDADLNNDCNVNFLDLALYADAFLTTDAIADLNGDGTVNFVDLSLMTTLFFTPPGPTGVVPNLCDPALPLDVSITVAVSGEPGAYLYDFTIQNDSSDPISVYSLVVDLPGGELVASPPGWDQAFFSPVQWCTAGDCFDETGGVAPGESVSGFVAVDTALTLPAEIAWTIAIVGPTVPTLGLPGTSGNTAPFSGFAVP